MAIKAAIFSTDADLRDQVGAIVGAAVGLLRRLFGGSREQLLVRLLGQRKLTSKERAVLEQVLKENKR